MARPPKKGPLVVPNCAEILVNWAYVAEPDVIQWRNVLHAAYSTPPTFNEALAAALMTAFGQAFTSSGWGLRVNAAYALSSVWVKNINAEHLPFFISPPGPVAGTGIGAEAGESLAVCVTLKTGKAGREWRGRSYLGGLDSIVLQDGRHHTVAAGTDAVAFLNALKAAIATNGMQLAIAQRALLAGQDSQGNALSPRDAHAEPVISAAITNNRLDTQRRRLGR